MSSLPARKIITRLWVIQGVTLLIFGVALTLIDRFSLSQRLGVGFFFFITVYALGAFLIRQTWVPMGRLAAQKKETSLQKILEGQSIYNRPDEWEELENRFYRLQREVQEKSEHWEKERGELSAVMGAINEAVCAVDLKENALFFNSKFVTVFGKIARLTDAFKAQDVTETYRGAIRTRMSSRLEFSYLPKGERLLRYFALSVTPLINQHGELYGAVGIFLDISELKRLERIRSDLVANVSHELRTPLTAIHGFAETLQEDIKRGESGALSQGIDVILRNSKRLLLLVREVLDLASLESGRSRVNAEKLNTKEASERVLEQFEKRKKSEGLEFVVHYGADNVFADPIRLDQVLTNLIENAAKYAGSSGPITVDWSKTAHHVELRVKDQGPGIPQEHLSRLFERFYRVDSDRSRDSGGSGLGLAIVKHILEVHGGSVEAKSKLGEGTELICRFPHFGQV